MYTWSIAAPLANLTVHARLGARLAQHQHACTCATLDSIDREKGCAILLPVRFWAMLLEIESVVLSRALDLC